MTAALPLWIWDGNAHAADWLHEDLIRLAADGAAAVDPFAPGRELHDLSQGWRNAWPREGAEKKLRAALAGKAALSHGVEGFDENFHQALVDASTDKGARHLLLHVGDAELRLALRHAGMAQPSNSLALSRADRLSRDRLAHVHLLIGLSAQLVHVVALDELALPLDAARPHWQALWDFLGLGEVSDSEVQVAGTRLRGQFDQARQGLDISWAEALTRESRWLGGLTDLSPSFLKVAARVRPSAGGAVRLVRFDRFPDAVRNGDSVRVGGVVVASAGPANGQLFIRQGDRRQRLGWGQPSPSLAAKMPNEPGAENARFKPVELSVLRRQPARLMHRADAEKAPAELAEIAFVPHGREAIEGVFVAPWSIGYQAIPKVACTSIKEAFFKLIVGQPFNPSHFAGADGIHGYFYARQQDVTHAAFRFVVVRDPIKRFLSAFANRVLHHQELSRKYLETLPPRLGIELEGFPFEPNLAQFVEHFADYRRVPTIDHHFRPFSEFCAPLSAFDKVYTFEELDRLQADLSHRIGRPLRLPHSQSGGPKITPRDLSHKVFDRLVEMYAADYAMLGGLYSPERLR